DYLVARSGAEMERALRALRDDAELRRSLVQNGLAVIRARHTCGHRAEELLRVVQRLRAPTLQERCA
ncbi:MAG: glycosyltransferase family 1 protein, partial [Methylobacterium sp.]